MSLPEGFSKRLIGPNLFFDHTGTVLDIPLTHDQKYLVRLWHHQVHALLPELGWGDIQTAYKIYNQGIRLALQAPFDITLAACDVIDFTWASVRQYIEKGYFKTPEEAKEALLPLIYEQQNLKVRQIYQLGTSKGFNVFYDPDNRQITIGSGNQCFQACIDDIEVDDINWAKVGDIPVVLITGTNGKTTTVRLTSFLCQVNEKGVGYCSTDWVMINGEVIDYGDYSGPTGNRYVLTNPDIDVAVLEVARGGLCTRGLAITNVTAASVTNVSADHLGMDGIETVEQMAEAKSIVYKTVARKGHAIVNLDSPEIKSRYESGLIEGTKVFFSQKMTEHQLRPFFQQAAYIAFIKNGFFVLQTQQNEHTIAEIDAVPITVRGYATHNIENVLNAICLGYELGLTPEEIAKGLKSFQNSAENNFGRANVYYYNGATFIIDFAHNPKALESICNMALAYKPERVWLMWGQTGDRLNLVDKMCQITAEFNPDFMLIKDVPGYLRGAEEGEMPTAIEQGLLKYGMTEDKLKHFEDEIPGLQYALDHAKPGDVHIMLIHKAPEKAISLIESYL